MYAQNNILCQFGNLEICPNFANPYLTQFSSISGGNCIRVGFGEYCGDAITHKLLDHDTQKIIYRSAVRPQKSSTPNHRVATHGGDVSTSSNPSKDKHPFGSPLGLSEGYSQKQKTPTVFIRSRDDENPSGSKPMPTFDPEDLIVQTPQDRSGQK